MMSEDHFVIVFVLKGGMNWENQNVLDLLTYKRSLYYKNKNKKVSELKTFSLV